MVDTLKFELVSPSKLITSKNVVMVTVPGGEGDYGVLAGHAPMITTVKPGVIGIYEEDNNEVSEQIFVGGGFAEVTNQGCTVLAEEVVPVIELNRGKLEEESKVLETSIAGTTDDAVRAVLEAQLEINQEKLRAIAA